MRESISSISWSMESGNRSRGNSLPQDLQPSRTERQARRSMSLSPQAGQGIVVRMPPACAGLNLLIIRDAP
jgi:hypothetical protein